MHSADMYVNCMPIENKITGVPNYTLPTLFPIMEL